MSQDTCHGNWGNVKFVGNSKLSHTTSLGFQCFGHSFLLLIVRRNVCMNCAYVNCTPLAAPPAADYIPYWCPGLEVYPGSCSSLPPRSLLPHPGTRGRSSLRSLEPLFVPFARTSTTQARAFSVVGPSVWNGLPLVQWLLPWILSENFMNFNFLPANMGHHCGHTWWEKSIL